jgi:hypothetical protein
MAENSALPGVPFATTDNPAYRVVSEREFVIQPPKAEAKQRFVHKIQFLDSHVFTPYQS